MRLFRYFGWLIIVVAVSPLALFTSTPTWVLGSLCAAVVLLGYGIAWVHFKKQAVREGRKDEVP